MIKKAIKILKGKLKRVLPQNIKQIIYDLINRKRDNTVIRNYYRTSYNKNVLISYDVSSFQKGIDYTHTLSMEALQIAKTFKELGYNVDVSQFTSNKKIDYTKYQVIFGFGEPLINSFYDRTHKITTIYYGTGAHVCWQNYITLKRIEEVYQKKGDWLLSSGRIVDKAWTVQTSLTDAIITLGNEFTVETYRQFYSRKIFNLPVPFYSVIDINSIRRDYSKAKYHFLWFGGAGLIHKGLDLLLEVFTDRPEIELHICGNVNYEPNFVKCYYKELYNTPNVHTHGFIEINSPLFRNIIEKCCFIIFPSCSEGGGASVINVMGNGGLIPIVTIESSIDVNDFGVKINSITHKGIVDAIDEVLQMSVEELEERTRKCYLDTNSKHSLSNYASMLKRYLIEVIN